MFSLFKSDPMKKLTKLHAIKLEQAMQAQRRGDMRGFAELTAEADALNQKILALNKK